MCQKDGFFNAKRMLLLQVMHMLGQMANGTSYIFSYPYLHHDINLSKLYNLIKTYWPARVKQPLELKLVLTRQDQCLQMIIV